MDINEMPSFIQLSLNKLSNLTDDEILVGFKSRNPQITEVYFFGYCRMAYERWNKTYSLKDKEGLDQVTLSTNYYVDLSVKEWKPLEVERRTASLCTWMVRGYRFKVLDALKEYNRTKSDSLDSLDGVQIEYQPDDKEPSVDLRMDIDKICSFMKDPVDRDILRKYILEGYQFTEIAKSLGVTLAAVSQRYKKIKQVYIIPYYFNDKK